MEQWHWFVQTLKDQALSAIQVLTSIGLISPVDSKILVTLFSSNIEAITNPDIIGK
jgi:hypothetical protein